MYWLASPCKSFSFSLSLLFTPHTSDESLAPPPLIQYGPANQTLVVGSTATFMCRSAGNPSPQIEWTKDGITLTTSNPRYLSWSSVNGLI